METEDTDVSRHPKPQADEDPTHPDLDDPDDLPNIARFIFTPPRKRAQSPTEEQTEPDPQLSQQVPGKITYFL